MDNKYKILGALAIVIVLVSVLSYVYLSNANSTTNNNPTPSPTPIAAATQTPAPTAAPVGTHTPSPTTKPTATPSSHTNSPTASPTPTPTLAPASLTGQGATFPDPLIQFMITSYTATKTQIQVNYQGTGSGAGINALKAYTADFAGSDAPLSASERASTPNALHIPETIGAVTIAYNLPGISTGLRLNGTVIADIFRGNITTWNDPAIQQLNPTKTLPSNTINVVFRSDASGTTFVFTGYLSAASSTWASTYGQSKQISWPVGSGNKGNAGVAATVEGTAYAIGYVELAYAIENTMKIAAVQNSAGNYITPTLATTTAAAQSVASAGLPAGDAAWTSVNILNAAGDNSYPIVSFSYILVYKELNVVTGMTQEKANALVDWLWYMVHDGQSHASALSYAALPSNVVTINEATIRSITFNGVQVYKS